MIHENLDLLGDCTSSAVLSPDGRHRFRLDRTVAECGPCFAFIGVNPSTADATEDDATVRKWRGFVGRWGGARFVVGNLFSYRATDVRELGSCKEVNHPQKSNMYIDQIIRTADVIVPCWGNVAKIPKAHRGRVGEVIARMRNSDKPVKCFGLTKSGDPKHPLMLGYGTPLEAFDPRP